MRDLLNFQKTAKTLLISLLLAFLVPVGKAHAADTIDNSYKVGSQVFLKGTYVQVGVGANGRFGTSGATLPTTDKDGNPIVWRSGKPVSNGGNIGFIADRNRDGSWVDGDFFLPGSPLEAWQIDVGGSTGTYQPGGTVKGTFGDVIKTPNSMYVVYTDTFNGIKIEQTYSVPIGSGVFSGDQQLNISVKLTNESGSLKTGIYYTRTVDPDNLVDQGGDFSTNNKVIAQYGESGSRYSLVAATVDDLVHGGTSYLGLFSSDAKSKVSRGGFSPSATAKSTVTGRITTVGTTQLDDAAIAIGFDVGSLANGATTTFNFAYVLSSTSADEAIAAAAAPPPPAPTVVGSTESATVSWTAPVDSVDPVTGYKLRYTENPAASPVVWTTINYYGDTSTVHTVSPLVNGHTYYFEVAAVTGGSGSEVTGEWSSIAEAVIPGAPTAPVVLSSPVTDETATVSFTPADTTDPSTPVTTYDYSIDGGSTWTTISPDSITSPLSIPGIAPGTSKVVKIRARNSWGPGPAASVGTLYGTPVWTDSSTATVSAGSTYSDGVAATAGITSYAVTAGSLPPGISLNPTTGALTGTATAIGSYTFTITATNPTGSISVTFTKTVAATAGAPTWVITSLGSLTSGTPVSLTGTATGATSFAILSGSLPAGLTLDLSTGVITGTPTTEGSYVVVIKAINGSGFTPREFSGTVSSASTRREFRSPTPTSSPTPAPSSEPTPPSTPTTPATNPSTLPVVTVGTLIPNTDPIAIDPKILPSLDLVTTEIINNPKVTESSMTIPATIVPNSSVTGLIVNASGWMLSVSGRSNGNGVTLDSFNNIVINQGVGFQTSGTGFAPLSIVKIYVHSTAQLLGTIRTSSTGSFEATLPAPKGIEVGQHILQVSGYSPDEKVRSALLGLVVKSNATSQAVIQFKYKSFTIDSKALKTIKKLDLKKAKSVKVYGYAANDKTNDDVRVSLFRALEVKKALQKKFPKVKFEALGKGAKKNPACSNLKNLCAIVVVTK